MKKALITGVTGQDGSYMAELLLDKAYQVHGIKRRSSSLNTARVDHIYEDVHKKDLHFYLHYGDLTDAANLMRLIEEIEPDEIYHLGAQSHVGLSFQIPEYTANVDALGTLRILEAIRLLGLTDSVRFYQASTSELYGSVQETPQSEKTPFCPQSPYAAAKLYAFWTTVNYREAYGIYACNGILFNHESPRRGETFVTRKITRGLARVACGLDSCIYLGNLNALRDWGHTKDFVRAQWLILQQDIADDYVIATGEQYSVRNFFVQCVQQLGMEIIFRGEGEDEIAEVVSVNYKLTPKIKPGDIIMRVSAEYFRPTEVDALLGDSSKAQAKFGWEPGITLNELICDMLEYDLNDAMKQAHSSGHQHISIISRS